MASQIATPENSFIMDKETYSKMVAMIQEAEAERQRAVEALAAHKQQRDQGSQLAQVTADLEKAKQQLNDENEELRNLCCFLDESRQKSKQVAMEWQSFGRYTAAVLKNETDAFECKTNAVQEKLDKLRQENKELREMCLLLDGSSDDGTAELKVAADQDENVSAHTLPVAELNQQQRAVPHYTGLTSSDTLKDQRVHRRSLQKLQESDPKAAVTELIKRVDRLEAEKLELVKSLSAAHLLASLSTQSPVTAKKQPGGSRAQTNNRVTAGSVQSPTDMQSKEESSNSDVSLEVISCAVTLLELTRQCDAAEANGYSDPQAAAEACALRAMINIAWQKTQEEAIEH